MEWSVPEGTVTLYQLMASHTCQNKDKILNMATNPCMSWSLPSSLTSPYRTLPTLTNSSHNDFLSCPQRSHASPCLQVPPLPETFRVPPVWPIFILQVSAQMSFSRGSLFWLHRIEQDSSNHMAPSSLHTINTGPLIEIVYVCGISSVSPSSSVPPCHLSRA